MYGRHLGVSAGLRQWALGHREGATWQPVGRGTRHERRDIIATPPHEPDTHPEEDRVHDEEDRLRPSFVREVLDAVADGDDRTARALVAELHPADIADLIELAPGDERADLIEALAGIVDADVYAELNDWVREDVIEEMEPSSRRPRRPARYRRRRRADRGPRRRGPAGGSAGNGAR